MSAEGLLLVDKPEGCTSHDVVARVRRVLDERRVGHAGTLDPFATGLLLCAVGRATRLAVYLQGQDKAYEGTIVLGIETDTGDREGRPVGPRRPPPEDLEAITRCAATLEGTQDQVPPAYSAKKVAGTRAYRLARAGTPPDLSPARVTVHRFRVGPLEEDRLHFGARVSSGTYVRALATELGRRLGCGAHVAALRRVAVGPCR